MSTSHKYFYLKLKDNFFDREEIKVIKNLPKGDTHICIILELKLRSLKRGGLLLMADHIPFDITTLAAVLSREVDEVKYAIEIFQKFGLLEIQDSGAIFLTQIQGFIGKSSSEGDRVAEYRRLQKQGEKGLVHLYDTCTPKKEIELETEKDLEREKYGEHKNVSLSKDERLKLEKNFGDIDVVRWINKLDSYIQTTAKDYEDHYATIMAWSLKPQFDSKEEKEDFPF
jgi:predicted phage replisome organizer